MRRQDNRLQEIGGVRVETLKHESEVMEALPEALEIERRSWKGRVGSAIACQPTLVQFYTSLSRRAAKAGWMRLSFLNVGGTRTAFEFGFEYKRRFFSIKIGFDSQEYGSYSVGRRLVHESIRQCFNEGLKEYDFVGAYSSAQEHWNATTRPIGWIYVYNRRLLSKLHHSTEFQIKPLLKRAITPFRKMEPPAKA
jgi:CelD/BcsL family acetyltransferase involved in cellulose biosynthesis